MLRRRGQQLQFCFLPACALLIHWLTLVAGGLLLLQAAPDPALAPAQEGVRPLEAAASGERAGGSRRRRRYLSSRPAACRWGSYGRKEKQTLSTHAASNVSPPHMPPPQRYKTADCQPKCN